ncbi:hypothetical protein SANA_31180 [Gottschalkiaceae bacterium SANA]|nr:hypothetical protein SANA_31180 [Gottschalkiaceae bacterium SANA]
MVAANAGATAVKTINTVSKMASFFFILNPPSLSCLHASIIVPARENLINEIPSLFIKNTYF